MDVTVPTLDQAPIGEVWRAYTSPGDFKAWNAASPDWRATAAYVDLREGGQFSSRMEVKDCSMGFDFAVVYTKLVPQGRIACAFGDRLAEVLFDETHEGVRVTVTFEAETTFSEEQQRSGWQAILDNLARHVDQRRSPAPDDDAPWSARPRPIPAVGLPFHLALRHLRADVERDAEARAYVICEASCFSRGSA